ncbi:MAG: flagellar assembly protein FliH [Gammaproteobacteria bacterium]|nr:flagellar assembly protein FliH [Gammaproteobacteria bacterium]
MPIKKVNPSDAFSQIAVWDLPTFDEQPDARLVNVSKKSKLKMPTADELEKIQKTAYDEAFQRGLVEGRAHGKEEGRAEGHAIGVEEGRHQGHEQAYRDAQPELMAQLDMVRKLILSFDAPLLQLDDEVEQELVAVAIAIAKHVVRRELRTDPGQVVAAVRKAVAILPINSRNVRVYLHPEDAALVRESFSMPDASEEEQRWKIVEDPALTRGGCNVETDESRIDATIESQLAATIAKVLGGEREGDHE